MGSRFPFQLVLGLVLLISGCSSTAEEAPSSTSVSDPANQSRPASVGSMAPESGSPSGGSPLGPAADRSTWQVYRNKDYGLELHHPEDFVQLTPGDEPRPRPAFRLWFGESTMAGSPLEGRMPPPFGIDIYDNPDEQELRDWLNTAGVSEQPGRQSLTPIEVAGREGLLLTLSAQLAPNAFYYVAAGPYVYRFTPLGPAGEAILESVKLLWDR